MVRLNYRNFLKQESEERRISLLKKIKHKGEHDGEGFEGHLRELAETKTLLENEKEKNAEILKELEGSKNEVLKLKSQLDELKLEKKGLKSESRSPNKNNEDTNLKSEYKQLKNQLKQVMKHLEENNTNKKDLPQLVVELQKQMDDFLVSFDETNIEKGLLEEKIYSWKKILNQIDLKDSDETLKSQYKDAIINLHTSQEKVKELEDAVQDLRNSLTLSEGEKCSLSVELKEFGQKLEDSEKVCRDLENEIRRMKMTIKEKDKEAKDKDVLLRNVNINKDYSDKDDLERDVELLKNELLSKELGLESLKNDLIAKENLFALNEKEKNEIRKGFDKLKKELDRLKNENLQLTAELKEISDRNVKRNLNKELKDVEEVDDLNENAKEPDNFKTRLDEELMKCELKLRDELQIEYQKRISDIERRYQSSCKEANELCRKQGEKLEQQDQRYREYLKMVLTECERCTKELENEKIELAAKLRFLKDDFDQYKKNMVANEEKYCQLLKKIQWESERSVEAWKKWSKTVVSSCLDIEETNKKVRDKVLTNLTAYDTEILAIQKAYDYKIEKKCSKKK